MKIATLGSCQAMALNWYIKQLLPDCEANWVAPEIFQFWKENPDFTSVESVWKTQANQNIFNTEEGVKYLKLSDYIIYQKIKPETSSNFNYEKIASYAKPSAKTLSFTYFQYDGTGKDPTKEMRKREELLLPDIKVSELILKNPKRKHFKFNEKGTHCNSIFFLEILRQVCEQLNWDFFDEEQYSKIRDQHYPFGENL